MLRDPKEFRQRFQRWKDGKEVYDKGMPIDLYLDTMERVARQNAENWGISEDAALVHAMNDNSYNYQGYYDKYPASSADSKSHWTDEFKTVYHPTFSDESQYHGKKSQYNPSGLRGGMWIGDKFQPATWQSKPRAIRLNKIGYEDGKDEQNWYDKFVEQHPTISTVASFLPIVGTAMDVYDAYKDPSAKNIGYAALSAATDLIGGKMVTKLAGKAIQRHRQLKKITKATEKELSNWPYYKNMNPTKAKREIRTLAKQKANRAVEQMDLGEELFSNFQRTVMPMTVYTPDFVANINQHKKDSVGYANGNTNIQQNKLLKTN